MNNSVVITGAGIVCSLGNSASEVWNALLSGKSGIGPITAFDASGFPCQSGAPVRRLDREDASIHPRLARVMDIHSFMMMKCVRDALDQCHADRDTMPSEEIGFFMGMGMFDYEIEDLLPAVQKSMGRGGELSYDAFFDHGYQEIYPLWPLAVLNNIAFCQVAISFDIQGENSVFSPHGDSGLQAVCEGARALRDGRARLVLAGGVSEKLSPTNLARAHLAGILDTSDDQHRPCRPFSANRRGSILGEGCGIVALEPGAAATARGVTPVARFAGCGFGCEVVEPSSGPSAETIARVMQQALEHAALQPRQIDVVMTHGAGTRFGDVNEISAIRQVFSEHTQHIIGFSSKPALGCTQAAAPLLDLILALHVLQTGIVPATLNTHPLDSAVDFKVLDSPARDVHPARIMINSVSYEGQCGSLIIEAVR